MFIEMKIEKNEFDQNNQVFVKTKEKKYVF